MAEPPKPPPPPTLNPGGWSSTHPRSRWRALHADLLISWADGRRWNPGGWPRRSRGLERGYGGAYPPGFPGARSLPNPAASAPESRRVVFDAPALQVSGVAGRFAHLKGLTPGGGTGQCPGLSCRLERGYGGAYPPDLAPSAHAIPLLLKPAMLCESCRKAFRVPPCTPPLP